MLVLHGSYMSGDSHGAADGRLHCDRPVIALDRAATAAGRRAGPDHLRMMADDARRRWRLWASRRADVLGYSMGGNTAIVMAVRHPDRAGKLIPLAGTFRRSGWYPEVLAAMSKMTAEFFAGGPLEAEYKRLSPTPDAFPTLVEELRVLDTTAPNMPDEDIRAIGAKTMVIIGDADGVTLEHAVALFKLRGGGDRRRPPRAS